MRDQVEVEVDAMFRGCPDGCGNDCCIPPFDEDDEETNTCPVHANGGTGRCNHCER